MMAQHWIWFGQGLQTNIAKKLYIFVIFRGGGGGPDPLSPSGSAHAYAQTCLNDKHPNPIYWPIYCFYSVAVVIQDANPPDL